MTHMLYHYAAYCVPLKKRSLLKSHSQNPEVSISQAIPFMNSHSVISTCLLSISNEEKIRLGQGRLLHQLKLITFFSYLRSSTLGSALIEVLGGGIFD